MSLWLLGVYLGALPTSASLASSPDPEPPEIASVVSRSSESFTPEQVLVELSQADVVYLGETHDRPADHIAQLEILQALYRLRPDLTIGLEMFQRPYQAALDQYLSGVLTEAGLQERSQYLKRWGYPWEFYAPALRFAKANRLAVVALNAPTEITRKVARIGLDSLTLSDRRFIPPRSAMAIGPDSYRQRLQAIYTDHMGKSTGSNFEHFFQAQVLWDETMAERIAQVRRQRPKSLIVVLVGQGHLLYGEGIPARVSRRITADRPSFRQRSVLLNPSPDLGSPGALAVDYFWYRG